MKFLDMTPYRAFRSMVQSCRRRPIREKRVVWVLPQPRLSQDGRFLARPLRTADIEAAAELWREAYPEVYGSCHDFILFPEDYPAHFICDDAWEAGQDRPGCMILAEETATDRLAAGGIMTKFDRNLQIEFSLAGTRPEYRRQGLMALIGRVMYQMALASGAEYLTTFLETWHTITQGATLKWGRRWRLAGIFPGNFTRWAGGQEEYRACEVYLYQFINDGEAYATPPTAWQLHPQVRRLWQCLEEINRTLPEAEAAGECTVES